MPQIAFHSRDLALGMCTEGRSIRQETSLSVRASRRSVLVLRAPTPKLRTSVAGTTLTSCPACERFPPPTVAADALPDPDSGLAATRLPVRAPSAPTMIPP